MEGHVWLGRKCAGDWTSPHSQPNEDPHLVVPQQSSLLRGSLSDLGYVCSLLPFGALGNFELDGVPFLQTLVPLSGDSAVMHKDIRAVFASYEPVPLRVVKPLDGAFQSIHSHTPWHELFGAEAVPC